VRTGSDLPRGNSEKRERMRQSEGRYSKNSNTQHQVQMQVILGGEINTKNYEEILEEKERRETRETELQTSSSGSEKGATCPTSEVADAHQENPCINSTLQRFWLISSKIIGGQPKLYEAYDRKLMEKIKLYKTKKLKIRHEPLWKK
jgi:hypothetical protein